MFYCSRNIPWRKTDSVFEAGWLSLKSEWFVPQEENDAAFDCVRSVRSDVNKCLDLARSAKRIGAGLQARVTISATDESTLNMLRNVTSKSQNAVDDLKYYLLVSEVVISTDEAKALECEYSLKGEESGVVVGVDVAHGAKCDRCWVYSDEVGASHSHPLLCGRYRCCCRQLPTFFWRDRQQRSKISLLFHVCSAFLHVKPQM